jgi:hypothetical protein
MHYRLVYPTRPPLLRPVAEPPGSTHLNVNTDPREKTTDLLAQVWDA